MAAYVGGAGPMGGALRSIAAGPSGSPFNGPAMNQGSRAATPAGANSRRSSLPIPIGCSPNASSVNLLSGMSQPALSRVGSLHFVQGGGSSTAMPPPARYEDSSGTPPPPSGYAAHAPALHHNAHRNDTTPSPQTFAPSSLRVSVSVSPDVLSYHNNNSVSTAASFTVGGSGQNNAATAHLTLQSHGGGSSPPITAATAGTTSAIAPDPARFRTKMCRFAHGDCPYKERCTYAHSESELLAPQPPSPPPNAAAGGTKAPSPVVVGATWSPVSGPHRSGDVIFTGAGVTSSFDVAAAGGSRMAGAAPLAPLRLAESPEFRPGSGSGSRSQTINLPFPPSPPQHHSNAAPPRPMGSPGSMMPTAGGGSSGTGSGISGGPAAAPPPPLHNDFAIATVVAQLQQAAAALGYLGPPASGLPGAAATNTSSNGFGSVASCAPSASSQTVASLPPPPSYNCFIASGGAPKESLPLLIDSVGPDTDVTLQSQSNGPSPGSLGPPLARRSLRAADPPTGMAVFGGSSRGAVPSRIGGAPAASVVPAVMGSDGWDAHVGSSSSTAVPFVATSAPFPLGSSHRRRSNTESPPGAGGVIFDPRGTAKDTVHSYHDQTAMSGAGVTSSFPPPSSPTALMSGGTSTLWRTAAPAARPAGGGPATSVPTGSSAGTATSPTTRFRHDPYGNAGVVFE